MGTSAQQHRVWIGLYTASRFAVQNNSGFRGTAHILGRYFYKLGLKLLESVGAILVWLMCICLFIAGLIIISDHCCSGHDLSTSTIKHQIIYCNIYSVSDLILFTNFMRKMKSCTVKVISFSSVFTIYFINNLLY